MATLWNGGYNHLQTISSSNWVIDHNLGTLAPFVDVWIDIASIHTKVWPVSVTVVNSNRISIVFSGPEVGRVFIG